MSIKHEIPLLIDVEVNKGISPFFLDGLFNLSPFLITKKPFPPAKSKYLNLLIAILISRYLSYQR